MKLTPNNPRQFYKGKNRQIYQKWRSMKSRCMTPSNVNWLRYGARGIKVCERWNKFENFLADMGEPTTPKHTLDRINNEGDYEPSNCKWSTKAEQDRNKRTNVYITINNCRLCLRDWCDWVGIDFTTARVRKIRGWSWPDAILTPVSPSRKPIKLSDLGVTWDEGTDY